MHNENVNKWMVNQIKLKKAIKEQLFAKKKKTFILDARSIMFFSGETTSLFAVSWWVFWKLVIFILGTVFSKKNLL